MAGDKRFRPEIYSESFLQSYLAYYFTVNVGKIQLALLEMVPHGIFSREMVLVDVGVGCGTSFVAALDFLSGWSQACRLHDTRLPVKTLRLLGMDTNPACLATAKTIVAAYSDILSKSSSCTSTAGAVPDELENIAGWALQSEWQKVNLNHQSPEMPEDHSVLFASNVFNELQATGRQNLASGLKALGPGSAALVIEPGDQQNSQNLNGWKRNLLAECPSLVSILPCEGVCGTGSKSPCDSCWNSRRESLHRPLLYQAFRKAAEKFNRDKRLQKENDFENDLLSWSYAGIYRPATSLKPTRPTPFHLKDGESNWVSMRLIGFFHQKKPVSHDSEPGSDNWKEWIRYIKFCPGNLEKPGYTGMALRHNAGIEIPALSHGDTVSLRGFQIVPQKNKAVALLDPLQDFEIKQAGSDLLRNLKADGFLKDCTEKAHQALDEIAYKLFGFPKLHSFQHRILERVLTGGSVLGIAATGGGKSECFILPAMLLTGLTVVVSPLKSLMQDQYRQRIDLRYGLSRLATFINGDISMRERQNRLKRMETGYYKLVYMTPEQLTRGFVLDSLRRTHEYVGIRYLALDEAHCISQWGHDFRPSYLNLLSRLNKMGIEPVRIALTATASPRVRDDLCRELELDPAPLEAGGDVFIDSSNRPELNLIVRVAESTEAKAEGITGDLTNFQMENAHDRHPGSAIVFMPHTGAGWQQGKRVLPGRNGNSSSNNQWSSQVTRFASYLEQKLEKRVAIYHGGMKTGARVQNQNDSLSQYDLGDLRGRSRESEQNAFMAGKREIMVATKGFGMGIDKPDIRTVIHRSPPGNLEAYAQEAGRAGRDGQAADAILYYSPDSPEQTNPWGKTIRISSDFEIQDYFLREKYVREEDIVAIRHFIENVRRRVNRYLYFTSDEAIYFLDKNTSYQWPKFPDRKNSGKEFEEHAEILFRGHRYAEKTKYIEKILSALFRFYATVKDGTRVSFLDEFSATDAAVINPRVLKAQKIVDSNAYFGKLFRDRGLDAQGLRNWIEKSGETDFLEFCVFLGLSPSETRGLLDDIRNLDGTLRSGWWKPALLDFDRFGTPKYGPAKEIKTLSEWRNYAGAVRRATLPTAKKRAEKNKREEPSADDWFFWNELPRSRGWEVLPGPALDDENRFPEYLEAFMAEHDARERNDRASFQRLLTDYIGVSENGRLRKKKERSCLRAVMLGYLKTNEVINGDNCMSCSRCVPSGAFEPDMEKRKSVVIRLSSSISDLLSEMEGTSDAIPKEDRMMQLLEVLDVESKAGRSVISYVEGWTGRLLLDMPNHATALWIRATLMAREIIPVQPSEFIGTVEMFSEMPSDDHMARLLNILEIADSEKLNAPRFWVVRANVLHRRSLFEDEEKAWRKAVEGSDIPNQIRHKAHAGLASLYRKDGPLPNADEFLRHGLTAARTSRKQAEALQLYRDMVAGWDSKRWIGEMKWHDEHAVSTDVSAAATEAWYEQNGRNENAEVLCDFLSASGYHESWPNEVIVRLLESIPFSVLGNYSELSRKRLATFFEEGAESDGNSREECLALAMKMILEDDLSSKSIIRPFSADFFDPYSDTLRERLIRRYLKNPQDIDMFYTAVSEHYVPQTPAVISRWLKVFPSELVMSDSGKALAIFEKAAGPVRKKTVIRKKTAPLQSPEFGKGLFSLLSALISKEETAQQAHQFWLQRCNVMGEDLTSYISLCLSLAPPRPQFAEEALAVFLESRNADCNFLYLRLNNDKCRGKSRRIDLALQCIEFMNQVARETGIHASDKAESYHFKKIIRILNPSSDLVRADIAATLFFQVCRISGNWLTPTSFLVESLCHARRFREARHVVSASDPLLTVGPLRIPAEGFLLKAKGKPRTGKDVEPFVEKIVERMKQTWKIFQ